MQTSSKNIGRPPLLNNEKKVYQTPPVRMTEEENLLFTRLVEQSGMTKSAFIKSCLFNKKIIIKQERTLDFKSLQALKDLGNNLNQIARKLNTTYNINLPALNALIALINDTITKALSDIEE